MSSKVSALLAFELLLGFIAGFAVRLIFRLTIPPGSSNSPAIILDTDMI